MTIAELKALIADLPDDMPVVLDKQGYKDYELDFDAYGRAIDTARYATGNLKDAGLFDPEYLADMKRASPDRIGPRVLLLSRYEVLDWDEGESE